MPKRIYLDHAATTPVLPEVRQAMLPFFSDNFGNPSALYLEGRLSKQALDDSRQAVAKVFNCQPDEIIFTGSGTESINLAIFGVAKALQSKGKHLITSQVEHQAVLKTCKALEKQGFEITYLPVDRFGQVKIDQLKEALRKDTILVTVMYANNEIGTINKIEEISKIIKKNNPGTLFHTDACQAAGALSLDTQKLGVDLLTINGSKIYGPKGIGALFIKKGTPIVPLIYGGGQEKELRSGTESLPLIVGLATALTIADRDRIKESSRLIPLRDYFFEQIIEKIPKILINGHPSERLPNNVNVTILDIEGEALLFYLDENNIAASTGSACTSSSLDPSHVILALGLPYEAAHGSLRFSLGRSTTKEDIDKVMKVLPGIVKTLRDISPADINIDEFNKKYVSAPVK